MFVHLSKKAAAAMFVLFMAAISFFVVSCQKELSNEGGGGSVTPTLPDLSTKIASSVSGFVTDETNAAVNGATVKVGTSTTTTDKYGYFEVSNVQVVKNAAVVTVSKPGYFNGIKTYIAENGHSGFFRIKILPKTTQGNFDAAAGGTVTLSNGLSFTFPANAVVVASSNAAYTGQVNVAAQWLDPTARDIISTMPGDLRGLNSEGVMKVLTSYGMSATELTGAAGELLQIAPGKKATINFPLPAAVNAAAPASIPLWHFDEAAGLWKEEGSATKSGSNYTGEVSHFSWWNCDLPNATVPLTFDVVNENGDPVSHVYVDIVPTTSNSWSHAGGYTDSTGHVSVLVTANASYTLSVYGECSTWGSPAYTQNFSVGTTAVNLPDVVLTGPSIATVSGSVECNGAPLADAYVVMKQGYYAYRYPVSANGTYSFTTTLCSNSISATLVAENLSTMQAGDPVTVTLVSGNNTVPVLGACVNSIDQFISYTVDGTSYGLFYPADSITHFVNTQSTPAISYIYGGGGGSVGQDNSASLSFTQDGIAAGATLPLQNFSTSAIRDSAVLNNAAFVNITEYGNVGEFIAGNFTCVLTGSGTNTYAINGNFRVRRRQ